MDNRKETLTCFEIAFYRHFELYKTSAIKFNYIWGKADISTADISNTDTQTQTKWINSTTSQKKGVLGPWRQMLTLYSPDWNRTGRISNLAGLHVTTNSVHQHFINCSADTAGCLFSSVNKCKLKRFTEFWKAPSCLMSGADDGEVFPTSMLTPGYVDKGPAGRRGGAAFWFHFPFVTSSCFYEISTACTWIWSGQIRWISEFSGDVKLFYLLCHICCWLVCYRWYFVFIEYIFSCYVFCT